MTIHVLAPAQDADTSNASSAGTAYDSVWAGEGTADIATTEQEQPSESGSALEQTMLSHDKLYVVLAVVLLVWLGLAFLLLRTDRRLAALERHFEE